MIEYRVAARSICNLKYSVPINILIALHNGYNYNYDYHFVIKELAEEFKKQFTCLGENTEKYMTFTVPIEKVTRINKSGEEITKNVSYILQFIDSTRFMIKLNENTDIMIKNVKPVKLYLKYVTVFFEYANFKDI